MYIGVNYYPEHWPENMIEEDIQGIKELGSNMVRIGEFAWHLMEPKEGKYDFSFFDSVIKKLKKQNIDVMFGTPTATFPALQIIDEELGDRFTEFTENGGVIIFTFRTGMKDKQNNIHFKQTLPGYVKEMTEIEIHEVEALSSTQKASIKGKGQYEGEQASASV